MQGHSLRAATIMATLRNSLSAYLLAGRSPRQALELVNHVLQRTNPDVVATVCCVLVRRDGHGVVANAGHLPPILVANGRAEAVAVRGTLLGIDGPLEELEMKIDPGSTLVQFTEGLVERRHRPLDEGIAAATATAAELTPDVEAVCDRLLADVVSEDDIAILSVALKPTAAI